MKRSMVFLLVFAVAFTFTLVSGTAAVQAADSVKVGVVLPLTGSLAKFGEIEKQAFQMALEEINAAGGINGKKT